MATANFNAMTNYMKTNYVMNSFMYDQFIGIDPFYNMVVEQKKSGQRTGKSKTTPIAAGRSQNTSSSYREAVKASRDTDGNSVKRLKLEIPYDFDIYAVGDVENKTEYATKDGAGAFVQAIKEETNQIIESMKTKFSSDIWRDGSGVIGKIATGGVDSTKSVLTIANYEDFWLLEPGTNIDIYSSGGVKRNTKRLYIAKVSLKDKTITVANGEDSTDIATVNAAVAATDNIFMRGDKPNDVTNKRYNTFEGVEKWVPSSAPASNDNFYGINRSIYAERLAGFRISAKAYNSGTNPSPIRDTIVRACVIQSNFNRKVMKKSGNLPVDCYLGSAAWEALSTEFQDKTEFRRIKSEEFHKGVTGFNGLEILSAGSTIHIWACPSKNPLVGHLLKLSTWSLNWLGGTKKNPVEFHKYQTGTYFWDVTENVDTPSIMFQIQAHPVLSCEAPGLNIRLDFSQIASRITHFLDAS